MLSVRFVRLIRECWTSIVSWDALKWPKWKAFPKTSSLWDAAYEETSCYNKRRRKRERKREKKKRERESASQRGLNMFATFMRKPSMMILYYITIWASPGKPLFRICVQKHSSRTHTQFPRAALRYSGSVGFSSSEAKRPRSDL